MDIKDPSLTNPDSFYRESFTIIAVPQIIWAKIYKDRIELRVVGEENVIVIRDHDQLFNYYLNSLNKMKIDMQQKQFN